MQSSLWPVANFSILSITSYWLIKNVLSINHSIMIFLSTFGRWFVCNLFVRLYFQIVKQSLFILSKHGLSNLNIAFVFPLIFLIDVLFQLIVILKPDFNCSGSFVLSWVKSYNWNIKFCISYWKCCGLSCYISNHYNAVCRPI